MTSPHDIDFNEFEDLLNSNESFTVTLSHNEILYLDDCLTLMIERAYENPNESGIHMTTMRNVLPTASLPVPIELMEKVGIGVLYVTDPDHRGKSVDLAFDVSELYMLREIAQSYIKVGSEQVGYNIKRKLYQALYSEKYENIKTVDQMITDYNTTASPDKHLTTVINPTDSP